MSYSWQQNIWPIPERTEIKASHYDDLRKYIYLLRFRNAGVAVHDYDNPIRNTTWAAWVDANFTYLDFITGGGLSFDDGAWERLLNLVFRSSANESADLYSCYTGYVFTNMDDLKANPPRFSNGSLNSSKWCHAVDISRYHDFDRWSGRRLIKTYTSGSGRAFLSCAWGYMYLPIQVGSAYQRKNIKYTNTGRVIISRLKRELTARDLTDTEYLGPNFDIECYYDQGFKFRKVPFVDTGADSVNMSGWQDGISPLDGDPFQDADGNPDANPGEDQHCADPKLKESYQNHVEQIISTGVFCVPVDGNFIANWNYRNYWWVTEDGNYVGGYYTYKRYGTGIWYKCGGDYRSETPSYANGWTRIDYGHDLRESEPTYAALEDELNGCNRSAFECALRNFGLCDWYFSSTHSFQPQNLLQIREDLFTFPPDPVPDPPGNLEAWVNQQYPLSAGTYRRTWKYTFGRPKSNYVMLPQGHNPPTFDYLEYQEAVQKIPFIGSFVPSDEIPYDEDDVGLTSGEKAAVAARHDPAFNDETNRFEQVRQMLNDMWDLMESVRYSYKEVNVTLQYKFGEGSTDNYKTTDNAAYQYAKEIAETALAAASWNTISPMILGSYGIVSNPYTGPYWTAWYGMFQGRFVINSTDLPVNTKEIVIFCKVRPWTVAGDGEQYALCSNLMVDLDTIQEIPNFDCIGSYLWDFPDDYPEGWVEWGGSHTGSFDFATGKMAAITLDLGTPDEDGYYRIPVPVTGDHPASISGLHTLATTAVTGRADVSLSGVFPYIGYRVDLDTTNVDFTTKNYVTHTTIAVDDGKFDANGNLI